MKSLIETALSILEVTSVPNKGMKVLVGMSDKNLEKLKFSEFPSEDEIMAWDNYQDRKRIHDAKDKAKNATKGNPVSADAKAGKKIFVALKLRRGDYTNVGIFEFADDISAHFKTGGNEKVIPFASKNVGGVLAFSQVKKLTKSEWESLQKVRGDAMQTHVDRTKRMVD